MVWLCGCKDYAQCVVPNIPLWVSASLTPFVIQTHLRDHLFLYLHGATVLMLASVQLEDALREHERQRCTEIKRGKHPIERRTETDNKPTKKEDGSEQYLQGKREKNE